MNEEIKAAESPLIFHDAEIASDANVPVATTDLVSPLLYPETVTELPVRKGKKLVTTLTLTSDNCRWPFGDPTKSGFHYCGRLPQIGRPYCDTHDRMSYQSSPRRKSS
jgi:GcrA cell cycle regulator